MKEELRDLKFYENNAMDDFASTPISVLRYITELESKLEAKDNEINDLKMTLESSEKLRVIQQAEIERLKFELKENRDIIIKMTKDEL